MEDKMVIEEIVSTMKNNVDNFFLIVMGIVVFLMQCGFAFLEAGAVRSKNTVNILIKNMLDCLIGGLSYWAIGWALAYGPCDCGEGMGFSEDGSCVEVTILPTDPLYPNDNNGTVRAYDADLDTYCRFIGKSNFFSYYLSHDKYPSWFFQYVFAATAATIVSGSIAERVHFSAYFVYSILITGWVYPPVTHWAWDGSGWLANLGYKDFAGSGVVHVTGGVCALIACAFVGPRLGRFTKQNKPIDMPGHSVPLAGLGGFILLFGFLAFNGGSQLTITNKGDAEAVGLAIVNTIIGGCGGGISCLFLFWFYKEKKWSFLTTLNGALTGMVAQCAGCNAYEPWAALLIGVMAGFVFTGVQKLMLKFKLDDPLDAVAVHMGGGTLGTICVPIFMQGEGIFWKGNTAEPWTVLGINLLGLLAIYVWASFWSIMIFGGLYYYKMLRIDRETEFRGNDWIKHGEAAYPRDAWVELQYSRRKSIAEGLSKEREVIATERLPPHMTGLSPSPDVNKKSYNDAFQMIPTIGALHSNMKNACLKNIGNNSGENNQTFEMESTP